LLGVAVLLLCSFLVLTIVRTTATTTATATIEAAAISTIRRVLACFARRSSLRLALARRCSLVGTAALPPCLVKSEFPEPVGWPAQANVGAATRVKGAPWENGSRVDHRISRGHVAVQLLRAGRAARNGRRRRGSGTAGDGPAAAHPGPEPADAGCGAADPRAHRPHVVGAEGV